MKRDSISQEDKDINDFLPTNSTAQSKWTNSLESISYQHYTGRNRKIQIAHYVFSKIEFIIKTLTTKKAPGVDGFTHTFDLSFKEQNQNQHNPDTKTEQRHYKKAKLLTNILCTNI